MKNRLLFPLDDDGPTMETKPTPESPSPGQQGDVTASHPAAHPESTDQDPAIVLPDSEVDGLLIRASAGTGKTYQLTSRYLRLLLADHAPECILATTFTRKAAGEILDRVVQWLAQASLEEDARSRLADAVGLPSLDVETCQQKLSQLTRQMHRLRIYTMDAFFMQVALSFSLELGLTPGWDILEEGSETNRLRDEAIAGILRDEQLDDLLVLLHQLGPKGEAKRGLDVMLQERVRDAYRLFLDSQPDAWDQLEIPAMLPDDEIADIRAQLAHFPQKGKQIPRAVQEDVERMERGDWRAFFAGGSTLMRNVSAGKPKYGNAVIPLELVELYQRYLPHLRALVLQSASAQTRGTHAFLTKYHEQLDQRKHRLRLYGFEEITGRLAEHSQTRDADRFAFRMDAKIEHLLLDEFQDTSVAQWQALLPLALRCVEPGAGRSFFCVGDVKQAIYGWRGGSSEIFALLDQKLDGLSHQQLQESRRSSPVIMEAVNRVFGFLPDWDPERLGRAARAARNWEFTPHTTHRAGLPGYFSLETSQDAETFGQMDQENEVFAATARRVKALADEAPGRTIGILCRTNSKVGRVMNELQRLGVPASEEGGNLLTDAAAVELVLSRLQLADHPGDSLAAFHLAASPWANTLGLSWDGAMTPTTDDAGDEVRPPAAGMNQRAVGRLVRQTRQQLLDIGFGLSVQLWVRELWPYCHRREGRRLTQLVEMAYQYQHRLATPSQLGYQFQRRQSMRSTDFVRHVRETKVADPSSDTIRVMTVHQAKGLEFDVVVLPDLLGPLVEGHDMFLHRRTAVDGPIDIVCRYMGKDAGRTFLPDRFLPLFDQWEDQRARDSLCVLYVAMTRAVHALHVILPSGLQRIRGGRGNPACLMTDAFVPQAPLEADATVFSMGDAQWWEDLPPVLGKQEVASKTPRPRLARSQGTRSHVDVLAPSEMGARVNVSLAERLSQGSQGRAYGTLIHRWLSRCDWLESETDPFQEADLRAMAKPFEHQLDVSACLATFRSWLLTEPLRPTLSREAYLNDLRKALPDLPVDARLEVRREQPVTGREGASVVSGTVDRLVLIYQGSTLWGGEVIDFKTTDSTANGAKVDLQTDRYEAQMGAYRRIVGASLRLPSSRVSSRLVLL